MISQTQMNAHEMLALWQQQYPTYTVAQLYGRHVFESLLAIKNCAGITVFNGINEEGTQAFVLIGTNPQGFLFIDDPIFDMGSFPFPPDTNTFAGFSQPPAMSGKEISRETAAVMINKWQEEQPEDLHATLVSRAEVEVLLMISDCAGIMICNALDEEGHYTLVLLPVDATGAVIA